MGVIQSAYLLDCARIVSIHASNMRVKRLFELYGRLLFCAQHSVHRFSLKLLFQLCFDFIPKSCLDVCSSRIKLQDAHTHLG